MKHTLSHHIKNHKKKIIGGVIATALAGTITARMNQSTPQPTPITQGPIARISHTSHVAPDALYPNSQLTTGKADTLSFNDLTKVWTDSCPPGHPTGCTYSQDHRNVPPKEHQAVYNEYNVPQAKQNIQNGEIDHFYPLCAGGSNDISNLWYQPILNPWNGKDFGFKTKDKLESWVCVQIKSGNMKAQDAFNAITSDWVAFYLANEQAINSQPAFGASAVQ